MSIEARRFLRLSLRARRDVAAGAAMRACLTRGDVDWIEVGRLIDAGRVGPLLHRAWRGEDLVPADLQEKLRKAYLMTAHRNLILLHELEGSVAALASGGVPVIVLKGAALAEVVYRNIAVRPLMDVDILMHREHVEQALALLGQRGFAPFKTETRTGASAAYENELLLIKPGPLPVPLEIHWSLFDSPYYQQRLNLEFCWQSAVPLRLGQTEARMLDPVSQVLHLCGHLVLHHGGEDLLWEHDIAEFVAQRGTELDWSALLERAQICDLVLPVQTLLLRLVEEDSVAIPADVVERLRRLRPTAGEERVVGYLTADERGVAQRFWTDLASMEGWRERLGYAWTHLFPSAEYMRERYRITHPLLLPFYYPYRWFRGLTG